MSPRHHTINANGIDQSVYEWDGSGTPILFVHATGFHARVWDAVIDLLPGVHAYALDLRGHGLTEKPAPPYAWKTVGVDVAAAAEALGLRGALGVGHSMGGHSLTYAQAHHPDLFARLLLIDPVILPEFAYVGALEGEHFASKRRADWSSPDEMIAKFETRAPFNRWNPRVLRDYVNFGLLPRADGGYTLACPPAVEGAIYMQSSGGNIYPEIAGITIPVAILRAKGSWNIDVTDFTSSPTAPDLASRFQHAEDVHLPEHTHFIPMEAPELVADYVRRSLTALA
ncbi:MAG: alpha/beta hydrolase [Anaerolinea sp.]|nr:alpha/beta hydrolase [Anaerolinea sp.]